MTMIARRMLIAAALMAIAPMAVPNAVAADIGHAVFMRGSIVDMTDKVLTICVGRADGAKVGQTLNVVRVKASHGKGTPNFQRMDVAKLRVDSIVDEHFARATVVSGQPALHDLVEIRRN